MKKIKKYLPVFLLNLLVFCGLLLAADCDAQVKSKKVVIISDIHFKPFYDQSLRAKLEAADYKDWERILASTAKDTTIDNKLVDSDSNYGILVSAIANIKRQLKGQKPAFMVIAGDFIWHEPWTPHSKQKPERLFKEKAVRFIAYLFRKNFGNIPIITTLGNNDTDDGDYYRQSPGFLDTFATAWMQHYPQKTLDTFRKSGYYIYENPAFPKLKFIVLNSLLLSNKYSRSEQDATGKISYTTYPEKVNAMFAWLDGELAEARKKGQSVWMLSHIPPGLNVYEAIKKKPDSTMWDDPYPQQYIDKVIKYASIIKFNIASHTHFNEFRLFYDTTKKPAVPVSFMRVVPSISPNHGNNPSFEIADVDAGYHVLHETTYYFDLRSLAQPKGMHLVKWTKTLAHPLGTKPITAKRLAGLINTTKASGDTSQAFKNYIDFYNVGAPNKAKNFRPYLDGVILKGG